MTTPAFDSVLFDFDGVLVDSEPVHFACWSEVLKPLDAVLDWEIYTRYCVGISDREMIEMLARRSNPALDVERLWAAYPSKRERFRQRMMDAPPFPPGLADFVGTLAPNLKLAVVTSSDRTEVEPLLERGGLRAYLTAVVCSGDVERHKPHPEPYLKAARLLAAARPLVVEDSDAGMASARAAGFEALRITDPSRTVEQVRARLASS